MYARVNSATLQGIEALLIQVEIDLSRGLPAFDIVGLPDKAVKESRERVRAAIKNSGFKFPINRITINLAPASVQKFGPHFDLPIAIGILRATGIIKKLDTNIFTAGELSLTGKVRKIKGMLPMTIMLKENNIEKCIIPPENYAEASLIEDVTVIPVKSLQEVVQFLNHGYINDKKIKKHDTVKQSNSYKLNFSEIKGQEEAKRALEVAAAGNHNILMIGPPGAGKTMLARRIRTILPPLTEEEALELTKIYSILGLIETDGLKMTRPYRAPHHNISMAGLIGGGRIPQPGEVSLAHHGTLFLDEMPEYRRDVLESLRQPLEEGEVTIIRSQMSATFPADIMLVAAMNPCPCGYYGHEFHDCKCTMSQIIRYRNKVSGPLMDRIDIHIEVPGLSVEEITAHNPGESSEQIKKRVMKAYHLQLDRYRDESFIHNSELSGKAIARYCRTNTQASRLLRQAIKSLGLSARAYDRILRMARTIADLDGKDIINSSHIAEAIQYRSLDRNQK